MTVKRPERRTSALAGQTPVTTPTTTAPLPSAPSAAVVKPKRTKMNYYATAEGDGRIRAAYYAGRDDYGWRNMTDMQLHTMMQKVQELEERYNNGAPFDPMPPRHRACRPAFGVTRITHTAGAAFQAA